MKRLLFASSMLLPLALGACAGGGGGGGYSPPAPVTPATIAALAAATVGLHPPSTPATGFEQASPGGPTFTGIQPANGTVFALTETTLGVSRDSSNNITAITSDTATNAAGATITITNNTNGTLELKAPNLSLDGTVPVNGNAYTKLSNGTFLAVDTFLGGRNQNFLNYAVFGDWSLLDTTGYYTTNQGYFIFGYQTPTAGMPGAGTATYAGTSNVYGEVIIPSTAGGANSANLEGDASLTVNFATHAVTGALTNMTSSGGGAGIQTWNSVSLTGTLSGSTFGGTTAATSAPSSIFGLKLTATGTVEGGFYGPVANEVAGVWTLSDGTNSAVGIFGAEQNSPPGVVGAFELATVGAIPPATPAAGYEVASAGGPTFTGTQPANGTVFALTQSSMVATFTPGDKVATMSADTATDSAGATVTVSNNTNGTYELKIPNLGIDATLQANVADTKLANGTYANLGVVQAAHTNLLSYAVLGAWSVLDTADWNTTNAGYFIFGYQTPPAGMPTSGTATYSGTGNVNGVVIQPNTNGGTTDVAVMGDGSLTANFGTGGITGSLTNMTAYNHGVSTAWNSVSITASIAPGTSTFGGTTAATSAPAATYALTAGATGTIKGGFYGPTANEAAAVWTLSDGTKSAMGTFGAPKAAAPSDRRLKRDIRPLRRENGLQLYSFRYLTDPRVFIGVMAQDLLADPRFADAVIRRPSGLLIVDYARLGLDIPDLDAMREAGAAAVAAFEMAAAA